MTKTPTAHLHLGVKNESRSKAASLIRTAWTNISAVEKVLQDLGQTGQMGSLRPADSVDR